MPRDAALARLSEVRHIVVVMLENRSFDQMLGYLQRDGLPELEGLSGDELNLDAAGKPIDVFEWGPDQTVLVPPENESGKILDPCHSKGCVAEQLSGDNGGFVRNFLATRRDREGRPVTLPPQYRRLPMGHYSARHLPTYDFLAHNFCVCDAWHSSVPGDAWPNRLFALAGREGPRALPGPLTLLAAVFKRHLGLLRSAPLYRVQAFTRQLDDARWRWYSHDPATLRAADARYRRIRRVSPDNFAFFDRQKVSVLTQALEESIVSPESFLDDCANESLREVSWIDPNFVDLGVLDPGSNDDHPPSDIRGGQAFVLEIYEALRNSAEWDHTVLVVVYDEHGGFYDHVVPPPLPIDDGSGYETYGVRVPALIVGPRVAKTVSHRLFDHASLIKTILLRFAADAERAIARMGPRVAHATHLGEVLVDEPRTDIPGPDEARRAIDAWAVEAKASRRGASDVGYSRAPDGAGRHFALHDFQKEFVTFALAMRAIGLPPGQP
jgi:phospholipase C